MTSKMHILKGKRQTTVQLQNFQNIAGPSSQTSIADQNYNVEECINDDDEPIGSKLINLLILF